MRAEACGAAIKQIIIVVVVAVIVGIAVVAQHLEGAMSQLPVVAEERKATITHMSCALFLHTR